MTHILYLSDKASICENPERLGTDFVISSAAFGNSCKDCSALLFTHNKNEFAKEYNQGTLQILKYEDPLSPARGVMWGMLISSIIWVIIGLLVWMVFFNG